MQQRNHLTHHIETSENTKTIYAPVSKALSQRQDDAFLRDGISFDHQERTYFVSFVHINPMQNDSLNTLFYKTYSPECKPESLLR